MKQIYITLITLFFSATFLAQGIAVQGIARDNNKAAITQETLNFTFRILTIDSNELYSEDASIRTDNFGVFSHIVGTGTKLNGVDFSIQGLRIEVSVLYPTKVVVYDEGFNYTPYAHYAANGAPTGSIMPYMGTTAPTGWLMCDGSEIPAQYTTLRAMFSNNRTPNLRGRFLKGAGTGGGHNALVTSQFDETTLGQYQTQALQNHRHSDGDLTTANDGKHGHSDVLINFDRGGIETGDNRGIVFNQSFTVYGAYETFRYDNTNAGGRYMNSRGRNTGDADGLDNEYKFIGESGSEHTHDIIGSTGNAEQASNTASTQPLRLSTEETRPHNFSVNYIIKL